MGDIFYELTQQYGSALRGFLTGTEEITLRHGYEFGCRALDNGLGVLALAKVYTEVLATILSNTSTSEASLQIIRKAGEFFAESLLPFEKNQRQREEILRKAHDQLERRIKEYATELSKADTILKEQITEREQIEEKLRQQNEYLTLLHETTLGLINRLNLDDLLEAIVVRAGTLMATPHGYIYLVKPGETEMVQKVGVGIFSKFVDHRRKLGEGLIGKVWQTGQPLATGDYRTWQGRSLDTRLDIFRAEVGVPLKSGSEVIGVIGLAHLEEGRPFREEEIRLLSQFAELASIALDNAQLYTAAQQELAERKQTEEKLRHQNEYLTALHETTLGLMNRLELSDLLETIVRRAGELIGTSHGNIRLIEPEEMTMVLKVGIGAFSNLIGHRLRPGEGVAGRIWQTGQPLVVNDYSTWLGSIPDPSHDCFRSVVAVPLKSGSRVVGIIGLAHIEEGQTFGDKEVALLGRFAGLASIALDNAQLYTTMQRELIERKQAEEKLRQLEKAVETMQVGVTISDINGKILYTNPAEASMHGYEVGELIGQSVRIFAPPARWNPMNLVQIKERKHWKREGINVRRDGSIFPVQLISDVVKNAEGEPIGVVTICEDITERKQVEEALRKAYDELERRVEERTAELSEANAILKEQIAERNRVEEELRIFASMLEQISKELRQFVETANAPIFGIDKNGKINEWNQTAEHITGFGKQEVLSRNLIENYITEDYRASVKEVFDKALQGIGSTNFEFLLYTRYDKPVRVLLNATPRWDAAGNIIGVWGVGQDITELSEYRESLIQKVEERTRELKKALEREKELNQLKSRFVSMASHEFRTPLTTILASSDILRRYSDKMTPEQRIERLNKIQAEVKHMTRLLEDVLTIGKAEAGRLEFNPVLLDVEKFCQDMVQEIQFSIGKTHNLIFSSKGSCRHIFLDEKLMRHIITNLLTNAVKYSPEGSKVQFELVCENDKTIFRVTDEGIGIPEEDRVRLFEPFHRAKNVGSISGTGLGLAIMKKSVELHGGKIEVESEVGHGTTFTISIPPIR